MGRGARGSDDADPSEPGGTPRRLEPPEAEPSLEGVVALEGFEAEVLELEGLGSPALEPP